MVVAGFFFEFVMRYKSTNSGLGYGILAVILWSTVSTAFKLTLMHLSPLGLLFFSSLVASIFLALYLLISSGSSFLKQIPKNFRLSLKAGSLNPFVYYLMLFTAYDMLPAQQAQVLNYTWAIVLPLMSIWLMRERMRWLDMLALLLSFLGVILISTKGRLRNLEFEHPWGVIIAVSTSFVWASYWILNMRDKRPAALKLAFNFMVGTVLILVWSLFGFLCADATWFVKGASPLLGITGAIYIGLFEMGLTFLIWYKALEKSSSTAAVSNLIFVTPFLALIFISLVLHERIHPATVGGLLIIIAGNLLQKLKISCRSNERDKKDL